MRTFLTFSLLVALAATAVPVTALPSGARLWVDGGGFHYDCGAVPATGTIRDALSACAATKGFSVAYGYGGCFLLAVNEQRGAAIDPSGFWLLGQDWLIRENGVLSDVGVCDALAPGTLVTVDYEVIAGYFVGVPTAGTAAWMAQNLA